MDAKRICWSQIILTKEYKNTSPAVYFSGIWISNAGIELRDSIEYPPVAFRPYEVHPERTDWPVSAPYTRHRASETDSVCC
jgi:hypothetical protein